MLSSIASSAFDEVLLVVMVADLTPGVRHPVVVVVVVVVVA